MPDNYELLPSWQFNFTSGNGWESLLIHTVNVSYALSPSGSPGYRANASLWADEAGIYLYISLSLSLSPDLY